MDFRLFGGTFGLSLLVLGLAGLKTPAQDEQSADDPSRGVARLSVIQGEVNVRRGDSGDVVAAALNAPVMAQDHVQTAEGSRAEIQFDWANLVRLAPGTDLGFGDLRMGRYQLQLAAGTILYRVIRDSRADAEIDTPSVAVRPAGRSAAVRVSVEPDGTTIVSLRSGYATVFSSRGSRQLAAGQAMEVRGESADPEFQIVASQPLDQFDDWSQNRDAQLLRSQSYQYVAPDVYGAEDLDEYGSWIESSYGPVWAPRVESGWAPYHRGRWVWEDYYGWTWVDDAPWGWAPFHYGRWFWNAGYGWCWWPGTRRERYYWRPALVGFFGFGGGGFGNFGWVALAPYETWHPWYGRRWYGGAGYSNRAVVNNVMVYNVYRNARINNGVAYTTVNNFGRGSQGYRSTSGAQIREASLMQGQLPVAPERSSLAFSDRPAVGVRSWATPSGERFFTHQRFAPAQRVSFAEQQQRAAELEKQTFGFRQGPAPQDWSRSSQTGGNGWKAASEAPPDHSQQQQHGFYSPGPSRPPNNRAWQPARGNQEAPAARGSEWQRFGAPEPGLNPRPAPRSSDSPQEKNTNGWHRFGAPGDSAPRSPSPQREYENRNFAPPNRAPERGGSEFDRPMRMNQPIVHERPQSSMPRDTPYRPSGGARSEGSSRSGRSESGGGSHSGDRGGSRYR